MIGGAEWMDGGYIACTLDGDPPVPHYAQLESESGIIAMRFAGPVTPYVRKSNHFLA